MLTARPRARYSAPEQGADELGVDHQLPREALVEDRQPGRFEHEPADGQRKG
jgi:hypothetical protein